MSIDGISVYDLVGEVTATLKKANTQVALGVPNFDEASLGDQLPDIPANYDTIAAPQPRYALCAAYLCLLVTSNTCALPRAHCTTESGCTRVCVNCSLELACTCTRAHAGFRLFVCRVSSRAILMQCRMPHAQPPLPRHTCAHALQLHASERRRAQSCHRTSLSGRACV